MHFGKHCPRTKANEHAEVRPRPEEQLDTREPSRLQSSLYRILRSKVREGSRGGLKKRSEAGRGGGQRQRREREGRAGERAQWREPEIRADVPAKGASSSSATRARDSARSCPARTALRRRKADDRKRGLAEGA